MTNSFTSSNLTEIESFLSQRYAQVRLDRQVGTAGAQYRARENATLAADDARLGFDFGYDFNAFGSLCLLTVRGGRISRFENRKEVVFGVGDTYSVGPPGEPHRGRVMRTEFRSLRLSPTLLSTVAGPLRYAREQPVRLTSHTAVSVAAQRRLGSAVNHIYHHVLGVPTARHAPLVVTTATQYLVAAVLDCFPSTAVIEPTAQDRRDARAATLRRALSYLEENATRPITVADIAEATHVTPRALQLAFRRQLNTTPMTHLRAVRLELVHRALRDAGPDADTTVRRVAEQFGFADYSRFSRHYKHRFAESPVDTLRS